MPLRLPRLPRDVALVNSRGVATQAFQQWWQSAVLAIEGEFGAVEAAAAANAAADAANAAAASADAAATAAQGTADTIAADQALINSGVTGVVITATDAGSNVTVSISAHTRVYGDQTSVSVNAGSVTALAYSTLYYIYYVQASRAGGAVTYLATTTQSTAAQLGDTHLVGQVTTPAAAGAPIDGDYVGLAGIGSFYF